MAGRWARAGSAAERHVVRHGLDTYASVSVSAARALCCVGAAVLARWWSGGGAPFGGLDQKEQAFPERGRRQRGNSAATGGACPVSYERGLRVPPPRAAPCIPPRGFPRAGGPCRRRKSACRGSREGRQGSSRDRAGGCVAEKGRGLAGGRMKRLAGSLDCGAALLPHRIVPTETARRLREEQKCRRSEAQRGTSRSPEPSRSCSATGRRHRALPSTAAGT